MRLSYILYEIKFFDLENWFFNQYYANYSFEFDAIGEAALLSDENPDTQNDIDLEKKKIYDNFVSEYDYNKWLRDFVDQIEDLKIKKLIIELINCPH